MQEEGKCKGIDTRSLLVKTRRDIHRRVARAYEQQYADQLDEYTGLLVEHYAAAGDNDPLARHALRAGHRAMRLNAYPEARAYYNRALDALARMQDTDENRRLRVDALTKLVSASFASDSPERNYRRMVEAESLARELAAAPNPSRGDRLRLVRIRFWMGGIFSEGLAHQVRGQALTRPGPACWGEADAEFGESRRLFQEGHATLQSAHARLAWSALCRERGDEAAADRHAEQARAVFARAGLRA